MKLPKAIHVKRSPTPLGGTASKSLSGGAASRFTEQALVTWLPLDGAQATAVGVPYLFAGLPVDGEANWWLRKLSELRIEVTAIGLLPLEWAEFLPHVFSGHAPIGEGDWRIVVSRHRTGGVRHVVLRGKQIVLTRLTADVDFSTGQYSISQQLQREVDASTSYIKRFGYTAGAELEIFLLGGPELQNATLDLTSGDDSDWHFRNIVEISNSRYVKGISDPEYADEFIAAVLTGLKFKHSLSSPYWETQKRIFDNGRIVTAAMLLILALVMGHAAWIGHDVTQQLELRDELEVDYSNLISNRPQLTMLANRIPDNIDSIRDYVTAYNSISIPNTDLNIILKKTRSSLPADVVVDRFEVYNGVNDNKEANDAPAIWLNISFLDSHMMNSEILEYFKIAWNNLHIAEKQNMILDSDASNASNDAIYIKINVQG